MVALDPRHGRLGHARRTRELALREPCPSPSLSQNGPSSHDASTITDSLSGGARNRSPRRAARVRLVRDLDGILAGLNDPQREAALALRGPVAILAGAGTGKTTTITHRIACQVRSGSFQASQILAVTFTEKAAGELKRRLAALGVDGVEARTFHAAALSQLFSALADPHGLPLPQVLDHKAPLIASLANALPPPHKFLPRRELAGEIEWAKNRMIPPDRYLAELGRTTRAADPTGADARGSTRGTSGASARWVARLRGHAGARPPPLRRAPGSRRDRPPRFHAFTVDEYQDVNPLQAALLDRWLGARDDLCVVGDDYQTIYAFTGASPAYLLGFTRRFPNATVVRLEENYRSTPEVLDLANRLAPHLGGFRKTLRATTASGPPPVARAARDEAGRGGVRRRGGPAAPRRGVGAVRGDGRPLPDQRSVGALRGGLRRRGHPVPGARRGVPATARAARGAVAAEAGHDDWLVHGGHSDHRRSSGTTPGRRPDSDEEVTRQSDLARMRSLAAEFERAQPDGDVAAFLEELRTALLDRAERPRREPAHVPPREGAGVRCGVPPAAAGRRAAVPVGARQGRPAGGTPAALRRDHARASVLVPHVVRRRAVTAEPVPRKSWGCGVEATRRRVAGRCLSQRQRGGALLDRLKEWRRNRAKAEGVPAYVVFHDRTLGEIADRQAERLGGPGRDLRGRTRQARALRRRDPGDRSAERELNVKASLPHRDPSWSPASRSRTR